MQCVLCVEGYIRKVIVLFRCFNVKEVCKNILSTLRTKCVFVSSKRRQYDVPIFGFLTAAYELV